MLAEANISNAIESILLFLITLNWYNLYIDRMRMFIKLFLTFSFNIIFLKSFTSSLCCILVRRLKCSTLILESVLYTASLSYMIMLKLLKDIVISLYIPFQIFPSPKLNFYMDVFYSWVYRLHLHIFVLLEMTSMHVEVPMFLFVVVNGVTDALGTYSKLNSQ